MTNPPDRQTAASGSVRRMRSPSTELRTRWPGLDGLRGYAVLAVLLHHAGLAHGGYIGVDVFFVLSGYLITCLLLAEQRRSGTVALGRFYLRRVLRLWPALLVLSAFCVAVALAAGRAVGETLHDAAAAVGYYANLVALPSGLLDHTWTLALEEQFYLVWPLLLLIAGRHSGRYRWVPALTLIVFILILDLVTGRDGVIHSYVRAMGLPVGCALALTSAALRERLVPMAWPAAGALLLLTFLPTPYWLTAGWPISLAALLAVPLIARLTTAANSTAFEWSPLRWCGLRSYSLYLWHFTLLSLTVHHAPDEVPHAVRLGLGVVASFAAAEASYRLVEQPVLRYRDRRLAGRQAPSLA